MRFSRRRRYAAKIMWMPLSTHLVNSFVVRSSKNDPAEIFSNILRCSYKPTKDGILLQRCNYAEQQVFYCSTYSDTDSASTSMTCLVETAWEYIENHGICSSLFTLSRWRITRPLNVLILPFSKLSIEKKGDFKKIKIDFENQIAFIDSCKAFSTSTRKPLTFRIKACVKLLPS